MVVWVELPGGFVVGATVTRPAEQDGALGRALGEAMARPLAGPARRPSRIRVADASMAAEAKAIVGNGIPIEIGPTPELDEVRDSFFEDFTTTAKRGADPDPGFEETSYLEAGRVPPGAVADLFLAANILRLTAPWQIVDDQQVLRVDIADLDLQGACVSIIGALGQNLGLLIFPSLGGFQRFLEAASGPGSKPGRMDLGTSWLSMELVPEHQLSALQLREVAEHGWTAGAGSIYPLVEHHDRDGLLRPLSERDVRIASACATTVPTFVLRNIRAFEVGAIEPVCMSIESRGGTLVRLTHPYEALPLFDIEDDPRAAAATRTRPTRRRNDPCHCGSGKKYKACHLAEDSRTR